MVEIVSCRKKKNSDRSINCQRYNTQHTDAAKGSPQMTEDEKKRVIIV